MVESGAWFIIVYWCGFVSCLFLLKFIRPKSSPIKEPAKIIKQIKTQAVTNNNNYISIPTSPSFSRSSNYDSDSGKGSLRRKKSSSKKSILSNSLNSTTFTELKSSIPAINLQACAELEKNSVKNEISTKELAEDTKINHEDTKLNPKESSSPKLSGSLNAITRIKRKKKRSISELFNNVIHTSRSAGNLLDVEENSAQPENSPSPPTHERQEKHEKLEKTEKSEKPEKSEKKDKSKKKISQITLRSKKHKRSRSDASSALNIDGNQPAKPTDDKKEGSNDIAVIKEGWVRVRLLSVTEKRALWNKKYLVLCVGELFVYKSEDKLDCIQHLMLRGCRIKILKMKAERCDLMIFYNPLGESNNQTNSYIKSNPISSGASNRIVISIRESIDTWMSQFEFCLGRDLNAGVTASDSHELVQSTALSPFAVSQTLASDSSNDSDISAMHQLHWETEISEKLKNSTRGRELLQEVIYVFHPKELNWVTRIMRLEMGVLHFYKEENHQITLQSMIYLSGCEINFENQHKNKFIVRIKRTNRNPICSVYTPSGEELKEFFNDYFIDLQFSNKVIAKKSLEVIQKAIELNIVPLEDLVPLTNQQSQAIYECDYQFLSPSQEFVNQQQNANPSAPLSQENSILSTFNILLSRYFTDIQQSDVFLEEVYNFLKSKFSKLPRPDFLGTLEVLGLDFTTLSFTVLDIKSVRNPENAQRIIGELNFKSEGTIETEIATKLNLQILSQTLAEVSVTAYVTISAISGKLHFHNPPQVNSRFELFFSQIPNYEVDIDVQFTEKKFSFSTTMPQLKQYFIDTLRNSIRERIVYPNKITFFIPFAGRPIDMRIEQVDNAASMVSSTTKIDAFKLSISRFIDEVLQFGKKNVIPQIFSTECTITGFSPFQPVFNGLNGVNELVSLFQQAFPILLFKIEDLLETESRISFKWRAEGRMVGRFWDRADPDDNVFILRGSMSCTSEYAEDNFVFEAKLKQVDIHWDTDVIYQILSLPKANANVYL